jgi:hypothetical protein
VRGARDLQDAPRSGPLGHAAVRPGGDVVVELPEQEPAGNGTLQRPVA